MCSFFLAKLRVAAKPLGMATDLNIIAKELLNFYDLSGKTVITVGAGAGQLLVKYVDVTKKTIAIDRDEASLEKLKQNLGTAGILNKLEIIKADFYDVIVKGDVVIFEKCLHEITDPARALKKAKTMAKDVLIFDHLPGKWSYYIAETEVITASWKAVHDFGIVKEALFEGVHFFKDYAEIYERIGNQGEPTLTRILEFADSKDFTIPMPYAMALI